jgi:hypothetical protein
MMKKMNEIYDFPPKHSNYVITLYDDKKSAALHAALCKNMNLCSV